MPDRLGRHGPGGSLPPGAGGTRRAFSQIRIAIEHAIAGLKRYNILVHRFRNRRPLFHDDIIYICAGLWNVALIY